MDHFPTTLQPTDLVEPKPKAPSLLSILSPTQAVYVDSALQNPKPFGEHEFLVFFLLQFQGNSDSVFYIVTNRALDHPFK